MNLIIRADDLGYSEALNLGMAKSIKEGIVNNVGFMVNMPYAKHGFNLIADQEICLGLHANISAGSPLSPVEKISSLVDGKQFKNSSAYHSAAEDFIVVEEAMLEIQHQLELFKEITGSVPQYIDVHAVLNQNFLQAAQSVAKEHNIPFVGVNMETGKIRLNQKDILMTIEQEKEEQAIYNSFLTDIETIEADEILMIVYHPGFIDADLISTSSVVTERAFQVAFLTSETLKTIARKRELTFLRIDEL